MICDSSLWKIVSSNSFRSISSTNLTLHKLEEFMEGEAFDEIIESLSLKAQEESLSKL